MSIQPDDPEPYTIERDLEFTQLKVRTLEKENAELKAENELLKRKNRSVIHIGKDYSVYESIDSLIEILVLDPVELEPELPPLPTMMLEPTKLCGTPRNRQERRHGRR